MNKTLLIIASLIAVVVGLVTLYQSNNNLHYATITVINELQLCEESNTFYKIIAIDRKIDFIKNSRDSLVLLHYSKKSDPKIYKLVYSTPSDKRVEIQIEGYFHGKISNYSANTYGCPESRNFEVEKIIYIK